MTCYFSRISETNWFQNFDKLNQCTTEKYLCKTLGQMCIKKKTEKCKNCSFWLYIDFICSNFSSFSGK